MSTNIPLETVPDPESELLPELIEDDVLPSLLPVFDDLIVEEAAKRLPESYDETTAIAVLKAEQEEAPIPIGRTWLFDFNSGQFFANGNTPRKSPADETVTLRQWIRRALTTERYVYTIYPDWFGIELDPIIGGSLTGQAAIDHLTSQIRETLMMHDRISDVINVVAEQTDGTLSVQMTVHTDHGELVDVSERLRVF